MLIRHTAPRFVINYVLGAFLFALIVVGNDTTAVSETTPTASIYTWQQATTGDWQATSSWTPARIKPAASDILLFNLGGTTTATNVPTQTIGQLIVSGNTTVNLRSEAAVVLTIEGGDGDDIVIETNSGLNFTGADAITANLASGVTAGINGSMTFSSSGAAAHRLTAIDARAVTFNDGAVFTAGTGFTGNPFGTAEMNSVVFAAGSTYIATAGGDPFGASEPNSVVVFEHGSLFSVQGNVVPSFSGRTYSNFELNYPGGEVFATGSSALVMDDLMLTAGTLRFNVTGNPGHSIKGNITISGGTVLTFAPIVPGTVNLNGTTPQIINRAGAQGVAGSSTIAIDNAAGVIVLNRGWLTWNLQLINGVVSITDPTWYVGVGGTVTRTNGYVNGILQRFILTPGTYVFDVGTENGYSPVTVNVTQINNGASILEIRAVETAEPNIPYPSKALSRYWELVQADTMTADLTFHYLDPTDIPATANESNFVIQRYNAGVFTQPGGVVDTVANTFRITGVTHFNRDWTLAEPDALEAATPALFDYDADGRTDISVFRPTMGNWYLNRSTDGFQGVQFGANGDKLTPADYDGDGKTDIAVYRPSSGTWYILNSSNGTVSYPVFGVAEDLPAPGDYDGDGKADWTVFRPSQGTWYRTNSSNGTTFGMQFGQNGDVPTVGDFDGDGKNDLGIFRPSVGDWYNIRSSNGSVFGERFGQTGDRIAPADYDGDGRTDIAIYRPSTGLWVVRKSATATYSYEVFGLPADVPISGDYDGDGKADIGVWRPSDGTWYIKRSDNSQFIVFPWGQNGDKPTPAAYGN